MLAGVALVPPAARAEITYTWHEDDFQPASGQLQVTNAAQAAGLITDADITAFSFTAPVAPGGLQASIQFNMAEVTPRTGIPISPSDAAPTGTDTILGANVVTPSEYLLLLPLDTKWNVQNGEPWAAQGSDQPEGSGSGHWEIAVGAVQPVPEPSTAVLAGIAAVCGLAAYGWSRHSQKQRRQRPVGETGPNRVLCGGFLGWRDVCLQARIPTLECVPEVVVQDLRTDLQQQVCAPLGPTHLLFLDHPLADHLIHRRFHERRRDRLAVAIAIPVVGDEGLVGLDVVMEFAHGLE